MATIDIYSPYRYCFESEDADGVMFTSEREPYGYEDLPDNVYHKVVDGDTWHLLAYQYFRPLKLRNENGIDIEVSSRLGFVIMDFQPVPVLDPFLKLQKGETIIVPSRRTLLTKIFNPDRRRFS